MKTIIWPIYVDSNMSRKDGRKINKDSAVSDPKLSELTRAAQKLNLNHKTEEDKSYPKFWWEKTGRIIIETENISKNKVLTEISEIIKAFRKR